MVTMDLVSSDTFTSDNSEINLDTNDIYRISDDQAGQDQTDLLTCNEELVTVTKDSSHVYPTVENGDSYSSRMNKVKLTLVNCPQLNQIQNEVCGSGPTSNVLANKLVDIKTHNHLTSCEQMNIGSTITTTTPAPSSSMFVMETSTGPVLRCGGIQLTQQDLQEIQQQLQQKLLSQPISAATQLQVSTPPPQYVILGAINQTIPPLIVQPSQDSILNGPLSNSVPTLQQIVTSTTHSNTTVPALSKGLACKPTSKLTKAPKASYQSTVPFIEANSYMMDEAVDLEELEKFAKHFKQRRIELGFTQGDVGAAIGKSFHNDFSQTTISRFEALNLSFKNMCKLKTFLQQWLHEQENRQVNVPIHLPEQTSLDVVSKRRKKRTTIEENIREILEQHFIRNNKPNTEQLTKIAEDYNLDRDVVRVWFCNRRQKEKRLHCYNISPIYDTVGQTNTTCVAVPVSSTIGKSQEEMTSFSSKYNTNKATISISSSDNTTAVDLALCTAMSSPQGATLRSYAPPLIYHNS